VLSLAYLRYKAHFELGITNSFIAASVFIIVSMTLDRYASAVARLRDLKPIFHTSPPPTQMPENGNFTKKK
jgi:hypothetical protein